MEKMENTNLESLTKSENTEIDLDKRKKRIKIIIIVVACVVAVTLIVVLSVVLTRKKYDDGEKTPETNFYGCMCDAGSSSTRVSVYTWPQRKKNSIPVISEKGRESTNPGMHSMNDTQIENAMNTLINYCKNKVNEVSKNNANLTEVSFYLKATAGMRSISEEEQNKKLDVVRRTIKNSTLKFLNDSWAKVITGSEEGVFGWITGNYLNRILFDNEEKGKVTTLPYGSIDLGGYSLEITFYTEEEIKEHRVNLSLSNINYNLYSYSFQDYGQDKFNEHLLHFLIENSTESEDSTVIQHPCYLNGYITTYIYKDKNYTIQGNNNIDKCKESITLLMNINKKEEGEKSMNDTYQPKIPDGTKFYGISGLYWIAYFFDLADDKFHAPSEFLPVTEQFCKKNWDDAVKEYSQKTDKSRLKNYCITGFYVYYFLAQGFKLEENKQIISFPDKISNVEVSWTLGAMSYEVGLQPLKYARFHIDE